MKFKFQGYQILQTLDEHSSSITAVRFLSSGSGLQMVSCGADKTILFRQLRTVSFIIFLEVMSENARFSRYVRTCT